MNQNEDLLSELKETLTAQGRILKLASISDVVRRDCALLILQAVTQFLQHHRVGETPGSTIRQSLALVLSELGPGDAYLRASLLETLQKTSSGRQQLLDIFPYTMPLNENERTEATEHTLKVFRGILLKDSSSLLPIIGCLAAMPLSKEGRSEAWKLALVSLSTLPEEDLPVVVQSLLRNVSNKEEASQALRAIRTEVDETQILTLVANLVLMCLQQRDNGKLLSEAYIDIFQKVATNDTMGDNTACGFLLLDLIVLLDLYQRPNLKPKMESLIDSLLQSNMFPMSELSMLTASLRPRQRSLLQERMRPALLELGLFLLLFSVRVSSMDVPPLLSTHIHSFLLELHHRLDRYRQEELVRSLLHLGDEVSTVNVAGRRRQRGCYGQPQRKRLDATCQAVHKVVMALAAANPASVARFKYMLIERLTSEKQGSGYQQVCSILVTLLDGVGGLDSTELMILMQKLIFSPSVSRNQGSHQEDATKVARGLLLAKEMVLSSTLSSNEKLCVYQWVLKILLPSNRRTVQPLVGFHGIKFLLAWSKQLHGGQASVFQYVKMIMANTGLVQMKESYLQRKRNDVVLAYTDTPSCFLTSQQTNNTPTNKKKRDLLFCVNTFLSRRDLPAPSEWPSEVNWISTLVNSYLQQGRKNPSGAKRSNWRPDGWLEASLELPLSSLESSTFSKYSVGQTISGEDLLQELREMLKDDDSISRKILIEKLLRLALALLLSMSLSITVLSNSHDHLQNLRQMDRSTDEIKRRKSEVLNLLKYQFLKVCDLKDRLELLLGLFSSMSSLIKRRASEPEIALELNSMQNVLDEAAIQGRAIIASSLNLSSLLRVGVMKTCLVDELDNKILLQQKLLKSTEAKTSFEMTLLLRSHALTCFVASYSTDDVSAVLDPHVVLHISTFMASLIVVTRPKSKGSKLSKKVSELIRLLSSCLEYTICVVDHVMQQGDGDGDTTDLIQRMLCVPTTTTGGDHGDLVMQLFDKFLHHLKVTSDTAIAMQMAEILCILSQLDPATIGKNALDVSWRMIHTIFPSTSTACLSSVSPSFARISKRFLAISGVQGTSKVLRASIIKCSTNKVRDFTAHPVIRRSLLLLWSLLAQPSTAPETAFAVLSSLVNEIDTVLQSPTDDKSGERIIGVSKKERQSKKRRKKNDVPLPTIPSLNGGTLVVYAEMSVHMVVSAFAVAEPAAYGSKESPFSHLLFYPKLLARLISLLEQNLSLFPRRFVSILLTSCHYLLEVTVVKTRQCVTWRNSQPLLTAAERKAGKIDYASIRFLESLLQDLSALSVGTVASFCARARSTASSEEKKPFGGRKVTALLLAAERTASTLKSVALAHNVLPANDPFCRRTGEEEEEPVEGGVRDVKGFDQDDVTMEALRLACPTKRKKRATIGGVTSTAAALKSNNEPSDEEFEWQEDQDTNDDEGSHSFSVEDAGFGVSGEGWGSDSNVDSDGSGTLQLESGGLFSSNINGN